MTLALEVDASLHERRQRTAKVREIHQERFPAHGLRERLLARDIEQSGTLLPL